MTHHDGRPGLRSEGEAGPARDGTHHCKGADPALFDGDQRTRDELVSTAREFCRPCPARDDCLFDARAGREVGLWGGWLFPSHAEGRPVDLLRPRFTPQPYDMPKNDPRCGTRNGALAHRRRREPVCAPCEDAERLYYRLAARIKARRKRQQQTEAAS